jgi:hypothetical protein
MIGTVLQNVHRGKQDIIGLPYVLKRQQNARRMSVYRISC